MNGNNDTDDMEQNADYWTRNLRGRLEQSPDYDPEEFEVEEADEDSPESAVLHVSRDDYDEDAYVRLVSVLQRGGFEVYTDGSRPVEGIYVARREPLEYPYAEEDRDA